jgi:formamidopyrimidine-DNA glycosylase
MPELPDVEVFRQYMNSTALHQKIANVAVKDESLLGEASSRLLQMRLKGREFESTLRHGKYLFAKTDHEEWLVLHFGMTGFLKYFKNSEEAPEHIRMQIDFKNDYHLAYDCQRKLGLIDLTEDYKEFIKQKELGIDPFREELDFTLFKEMMQGRRGSVKSSLMNQQLMAGVGNVYSDEILFHAKIHPESTVKGLSEEQLKTIFMKMKEVLETAIDKNVEPGEFPESFLLTHRGPGEKCPLCGGKIEKSTVSGRSSYYCPDHQKLVQ